MDLRKSRGMIANQFGTFERFRYTDKQQFNDPVRVTLGWKHSRQNTRNVVEWRPRPGVVLLIDYGTAGSICTLTALTPEEQAKSTLYNTVMREIPSLRPVAA